MPSGTLEPSEPLEGSAALSAGAPPPAALSRVWAELFQPAEPAVRSCFLLTYLKK